MGLLVAKVSVCSEGGLSTSPLGAAMADAATAGPADDEGPAPAIPQVEDAGLYMQGQERTARATGQRQWLARGVSPEQEPEKRAAAVGHWGEANAIFRCALRAAIVHATAGCGGS